MCHLRELQVTSMCHLRDLMEIRSHLGTSTAMTHKMSQCSADWYMVAMVPEMVPAMVPEI